jgi:hypothetical protein
MRRDRVYLEQVCAELTADGLDAEPLLGCGDPADEILAAAERERCDLIAMATHGHRFLADVVYGSVAEAVRHRSLVPVLLVRGERRVKPRDETPADPVDAGTVTRAAAPRRSRTTSRPSTTSSGTAARP